MRSATLRRTGFDASAVSASSCIKLMHAKASISRNVLVCLSLCLCASNERTRYSSRRAACSRYKNITNKHRSFC